MNADEAPRCTIIGYARTEVADDEIPRRRRELVSTVEILPEFRPALLGIESYSHLFVLFWMHRTGDERTLTCQPRGRSDLPRTGVLASRGRNHPNPIGLAVVELLKYDEGRLTVTRLDAFDGTPIIDVKPYDDYDIVHEPRVPDWFRRRRSA